MMDEESAQRGVTVTLSPDLRDDGWGEEGHQIWAPDATAAKPKPATGNCSLSLPSMSSICSLAMACSRRWKPVTGCCSLSWFSICSLSMAFASFQRVNLLAFLVSDSSTRPVDQPKTDSYENKSSANHCLNQGGTRQIGPLIFVGPICKNQWIKLIYGYQEIYYYSTYSIDIYHTFPLVLGKVSSTAWELSIFNDPRCGMEMRWEWSCFITSEGITSLLDMN